MRASSKVNIPLKVERGVPFVTTRGRRKPLKPYPFENMSQDDSFFIAAATPEEQHRVVNRIIRYAAIFRREYGNDYKFPTRCVDGGVRCWRTK